MFKKIVSLVLAALMLTGAAFGLVSCGDEATEPVGGGAQISVYLGGPVYDFDPQSEFTDDAALSVINLLFEPLFRLDSAGKLQLAGASGYHVNKKAGTITVDLRENYWSDGSTPVKASDYVYAWQKLIRCDNASPAAVLLYDIKNALQVKSGDVSLDEFGVRAEGNSTLIIEMEEGFTAYDAFLRNLASIALSPVNSLVVAGKEDFWGKRRTTISSNGPFMVDEYDLENGTFTLARSTSYHRPYDSESVADAYVTPNLLKTVWNLGVEESDPAYVTDTAYLNSLLDSLTAKTVFYVGDIAPEKRVEYKNQAVVSDLLSTYSYVFNSENPLFADPAVRTIMSQVIDRSHIVSLVTFGKAATGLIPNTVAYGTSLSAKNGFRTKAGDILSATAALTIDQAKAKLSELSYTPGAFTLTYQDNGADKLIAEYIAGEWTKLGFTVELEAVSGKERGFDEYGGGTESLFLMEAEIQYLYETRQYDVIGIDYQMYSTDAFAALAALSTEMNGNGIDVGSGDGITTDEDGNQVETYGFRPNLIGYSNEAFDAKIEAAQAEKDPAKRAALLAEAEKLLLGDMPLIPLLFNQSFYLVSSDLSGITVDRFGRPSFTKAEQKNYEQYLPEDALTTTPPQTTEPEETEPEGTEPEA